MKDCLDTDTITLERASPAGVAVLNRDAGDEPAREPQELAASDSIDIYHWAAVALVTALMCAVLGYAAGTPALARAANVTSLVFGVTGGALTASRLIRRLRGWFAAHGGIARRARVS
ncbi:hypothetical protein BRCH_04066 [Candidatus Burkholderia brachyanthoides]|nr:hypothetical protein BRCH_04066 [Candidatus Burkholderia brachyanthoides]